MGDLGGVRGEGVAGGVFDFERYGAGDDVGFDFADFGQGSAGGFADEGLTGGGAEGFAGVALEALFDDGEFGFGDDGFQFVGGGLVTG